MLPKFTKFLVARSVGVAGKRVNARLSPNVVPTQQKMYITLSPQFQSLQPCLVSYNTSLALITKSQLLRYGNIFVAYVLKYKTYDTVPLARNYN
jgi:hypothetical protein